MNLWLLFVFSWCSFLAELLSFFSPWLKQDKLPFVDWMFNLVHVPNNLNVFTWSSLYFIIYFILLFSFLTGAELVATGDFFLAGLWQKCSPKPTQWLKYGFLLFSTSLNGDLFLSSCLILLFHLLKNIVLVSVSVLIDRELWDWSCSSHWNILTFSICPLQLHQLWCFH